LHSSLSFNTYDIYNCNLFLHPLGACEMLSSLIVDGVDGALMITTPKPTFQNAKP
jgi:hypothetical protein